MKSCFTVGKGMCLSRITFLSVFHRSNEQYRVLYTSVPLRRGACPGFEGVGWPFRPRSLLIGTKRLLSPSKRGFLYQYMKAKDV